MKIFIFFLLLKIFLQCCFLDMSLAIDDQRLVNEMHSQPRYLRKILCNGMTKRFPCLPLTVRGSVRDDFDIDGQKKRSRSQSTTDDDEEGLTPGLNFFFFFFNCCFCNCFKISKCSNTHKKKMTSEWGG